MNVTLSAFLRVLVPPTVLSQFKRFRAQRRAWISLWLLIGLYGISLVADLFANGTPWRIRFEGETFYPWWSEVTRDDFYGDDVATQPDYRELLRSERFSQSSSNTMNWAWIPFGPQNTLSAEDIALPQEVMLIRQREQRVGTVQLDSTFTVLRAQESEFFFGTNVTRHILDDFPDAIAAAVTQRFQNQPTASVEVLSVDERFMWSLSAYTPRSRAPRSVRVLLRERWDVRVGEQVPLNEQGEPVGQAPEWFFSLSSSIQDEIRSRVKASFEAPVGPMTIEVDGDRFVLRFERETVHFPFRPVEGHPLGVDESGRDVLVLLLFATRIALSFAFVLVLCSVVLGTFIGGLQGYFGGWLDLIGQRLIEVYESIPFLYVMIFLGAIYGRSFTLLLLVYAAFNWVGISYYMRAEYLKGRAQPYTEAARALGLPTGRIMWRHILPNSLVPLITLFPFLLVGAIGSLSALDYLGFGMPVGTPSWGDLLRQAQRYRYAWWLITYPSLALFVVILLGVFIGEGLRAAFDPKRATRWEA